MKYWLLKSEPSCYSIDDLQKAKRGKWDGVRNFQARNFLRDEMKNGDLCIFYHSNATPPCAVGVCTVVAEKIPDHTAFDPNADHFDPKSDPENPTWYLVEVEFVEKFLHAVPLQKMRENPKLEKMKLLQKGSRLSVLPVEKSEFFEICEMGKNLGVEKN